MAAWAPPWRGGCSGKSKWSCSCGTEDNYATRKHCCGCGAKAPRRPSTFKEALLGPSKREVAMQKKLDVLTQELTAPRGSGKVGKEETVDGAKEAPQVDLARLHKWAQACKSERGRGNSEEYKAAFAKYQAARAEKDNAKPHSVQLTQAKHAREKLEKEVEASAKDVSWHEQQLEEARAKYEKKKEQLQMATAKEQELKVQDCGVRESPEFLKATQRHFEDAVDGSGVTKEEYQQVSDLLGKVMANAKQEDVDMVGAQEHQEHQEKQLGKHYPRKQNSQSPLLKSRDGSGQAEYQKKLHLINGSVGRRCAPAWPGRQPRDSGEGSKRNRKPQHDTVTQWTCYEAQELHLNTDKLAVVTQSMKAEGYLMGGAAAVATAGQPRQGGSGVALSRQRYCARLRVLVDSGGHDAQETRSGSHMRLESCRVSGGVPRVIGVIGGDFQAAPDVMANVASVQVAKATVVTANAACGTYRHARGNSEIDYFAVANSVIAQVERVAVQETWPAAPRKPVGRTLKLKAEQLRVRVLGEPKELPEVPIGGVPKPPRYADVKEFSTQMAANTEWTKYMQVLEKEAVQVRGMKWEVRPHRMKYISVTDQGIWQARCDVTVASHLRDVSRGETFQAWVKEAESKMKTVDQQLLKDRSADTMAKAADPMEAAEFTFAQRKDVWRVGEVYQEDVSRLKEVVRTFMKRTGIGVDRWHPSMLQGASDEAYSKLLDTMREVERALGWPTHMGTVLFFIIPKPFTTDRVIGLLHTTIRIWEIMRAPYMTRWAEENQRSWDCTSFGKAAEDAARDALLSHEMDDPEGQSEELEATITAALDLIKAPERVSLFVLWEAGKQLNFSTGALAVVRSHFAMARRLIAGGSVSSATSTVGAIVAGGKFSVRFLKLVIQSAVDGLVVERHRAKWRMHVDDLCVRLRQQRQYILQDFSDTIDACFGGFDKLGLKLSVSTQGEEAAMASAKWVRRAAAKEMKARGLPVVRARPYLGVDLIANGAAAKTKRGKRCKTMLDRSRRLANPKGGGRKMAKGAALVFKCGLKRSVLYGCKCLGMPDHQLRRTRRQAGRALPGGRGAKSLALQLALANEEPAYEATEGTRACGGGDHVAQACAVDVASLGMGEVRPMDVAGMPRKDVQRKLRQDWAAADEYASLRPAPMVAPAVAQLKARDFPKHAKSAARKAFIGGGWSMSKRCECKIVPADICLACGEAVGTPHHGHFKCQALRERRLHAQPEWQTVAAQQEDSLLWARGLVGHPEEDWKSEGVDEGQLMCQTVEGDEDYFTGDIVCDGPNIGYSEWAQTGWAAMSINENGTPKYQMWGPLPCTLPMHREIKRAEMWAFYKGERWCISWKRPHADIWKRILHKIRDLDLGVNGVFHVKAHRPKAKIEQLTGTELRIAKGNAEVDLLAKAGAEVGANDGKHQTVEAPAGRARWAAQNIGWWHQQMEGEWPDVPKRV
ncbi:unnamed protein product, partial [Prorocentrum cordatum]